MKSTVRSPALWPFESAEPEEVGLSSPQLQSMTDVVDRFVESGRIAGAVVAVARRGKLAHLSLHGWQNREAEIPMAEDSIFRVYSMTKVVTSVCLLQLFENGRIGLETEVREILPCFDQLLIHTDPVGRTGPLVAPERPPTVYDLLRHMAGLDYAPMWPLCDPGDARNLQEVVEGICRRPMVEQPGKRWSYSSATDVLGRIIEVISGLGLDAYTQRHVFDPLGMVDTGFDVPEEKRGRLCSLYGDGEDPAGAIASIDGCERDSLHNVLPHRYSGGGGLVSTTPDLMRFNSALLNRGTFDGVRLLGRKTLELMCSDHLPPEHPAIEFTGKQLRFGLGVSVVRDLGESGCVGSVGEFGWGGAAGTMEWIDPAEEMVSLLMIQSLSERSKGLEHRFKAALYSALM